MINTEHTGGVKTIDEVLNDLARLSYAEGTWSSEGSSRGYRYLVQHAKAQLEALIQNNAIEARKEEVRVGSDLHHIMKRADRMKWSSTRLAELDQLRTANQTLKGEE